MGLSTPLGVNAQILTNELQVNIYMTLTLVTMVILQWKWKYFFGRISHCFWFMSGVKGNRSAQLQASFQILISDLLSVCSCSVDYSEDFGKKDVYRTFQNNVFLVVKWNVQNSCAILTLLAWGSKIKTNIWYKFI